MGELSGILNLHKPAGTTSAGAVTRVKRCLPRGTKVGHAGTLDEFATGVLLVLIGKATKQCEMLMSQPKQYEATIRLGATTPTDDPTSAAEPYLKPAWPTRDLLLAALPRFIGTIQQRPPAYSALKIGGRRASDRVRDGEVVPMAARTVRIDSIELLEFELPLVRLRIDCGRGTYVRAIARDLGSVLGCGGYLTQLSRTKVGEYSLSQALPMELLTADSIQAQLQAVVS